MSEVANGYCFICGTPLAGASGAFFRLIGISRSHQCPKLCTRCDSHVVEGDLGEISVLFVDLVGFTQLTHEIGPVRTHEVVDAFLQAATAVLVRHDAFIDKYIGDAAMALFNAPIPREDHVERAVAAGLQIHAEMPALSRRFGRQLSARIGISVGNARLGRVGSSHAKDYTAIGEVVNLAARLQEHSSPGAVMIDENAYRKVRGELPGIPPRSLRIKGLEDPVVGYNISGTAKAPRLSTASPARDRYVSLGSVIVAALGAPCAAAFFLGPLAAPLGLASFISATSALVFLDRPVIRAVSTSLAALGMGANLYTCWHVYRARRKTQFQAHQASDSPAEWARLSLVLSSVLLSALIIAAEIFAHRKLHDIG